MDPKSTREDKGEAPYGDYVFIAVVAVVCVLGFFYLKELCELGRSLLSAAGMAHH